MHWLRRPLVDALGSLVDSMPAVALGGLLSYSMAVVGTECFHGVVHAESGYPGVELSFDSFDGAVLILVQVAVGGWSRLLMGGVPSSYSDDQLAVAAADGRAAPTMTSSVLVSWYLVLYRVLVISLVVQLLCRVAADRARDRTARHNAANQDPLRVEAAAAAKVDGGGGASRGQIVPVAASAWPQLPGAEGAEGGGGGLGAPLAIMDKPVGGGEAGGAGGGGRLPTNPRDNELMREQLISGVNRLKAELAIMG